MKLEQENHKFAIFQFKGNNSGIIKVIKNQIQTLPVFCSQRHCVKISKHLDKTKVNALNLNADLRKYRHMGNT